MTVANHLYGRVVKVRAVGKKLIFVVVSSNGKFIDCLLTRSEALGPGDYVLAKGVSRAKPVEAQRKEGTINTEFVIDELQIIKAPNVTTEFFNKATSLKDIESMRVRTRVNKRLHEFFASDGFLPVQSPSIVGDWVEGRTGSFQVQFFKERAFLTISRMIHHQIIQSFGYNNIYEIGTLFRSDSATSPKRLAEFTNVIAGITNGKCVDLMKLFTRMISTLHDEIVNDELHELRVPASIEFDHIDYQCLLAKSGVSAIRGHQLPSDVRAFLDRNFRSFVWVTGFPEYTRPFFVRSEGGRCDDCQLWFKGSNFLAAGGVRETDVDVVCRKIVREGKDPRSYEFYLDALRMGLPPIANIDMGIERFLANLFGNCRPADFTFFPRYFGHISP